MENQKKIDKYLMGNFSKEEEASFLIELEKDKTLQEDLAIAERLIKGIRAEARLDLKADLQQIHDHIKPSIGPPVSKNSIKRMDAIENKKTAQINRRLLPWMAAASVLLVISLFWFSSRSVSSEKLFAQNYSPYDLSMLVRDQVSDAALVSVNDLYREGKYEQAIPLFENRLKADPEQNLLRMGLANSYLEIGKWEKAQTEFTRIYKSNDPFLKDQSVWYLSLISLQQNDKSQAKEYLQLLANNPKADRHEEAKAIMKKIK